MATRKIFIDDNSKMELYVNQENQLFINIEHNEDAIYSGFITLTKEDVEELQSEIANYLEIINSNGEDNKA